MTSSLRQQSAREFPCEAAAVRAARDFVIGSPLTDGVDSEALALAVSELATNVVLHAHTRFVINVERLSDGVRVSITDEDPSMPRIRDVDPASTTGRGLAIVRSLGRDLQIDEAELGKTVWFELGWAT